MSTMSLTPVSRSPPASPTSVGRSTTSYPPREDPLEPGLELAPRDAREEPHPAEVHAEAGDARAEPALKRPQHRAVAAQHDRRCRGRRSPTISTPQRAATARRRSRRVADDLGAAVGQDGRARDRHAVTTRRAHVRSGLRHRRSWSSCTGCACDARYTRYSRFPAGPGTQESHTPRTAQPLEVANPEKSCNTLRRTSASRTTPRRTSPRPASNCGFTSTSARHGSAAHASTAGSTRRSEMNETSAVTNPGPERQRSAVQRARVRPVDHRDPGVGAEAFVELVSAHVERDDRRSPVLEEAVREPACRRPDVEALLTGDGDAERGQRRLELLPAARHVSRRRDQLDGRVVGCRRAGLRHRRAVHADTAGHDERLRPAPGVDQPALDEEHVKPSLRRHPRPGRSERARARPGAGRGARRAAARRRFRP